HGVSFGWIESCGLCRSLARAPTVSDATEHAAPDCFDRTAHSRLRQSCRSSAKQSQTFAGVLQYRACGLLAHRCRLLRWAGSNFLSRCLFTDDALELCDPDCCRATNCRRNLEF